MGGVRCVEVGGGWSEVCLRWVGWVPYMQSYKHNNSYFSLCYVCQCLVLGGGEMHGWQREEWRGEERERERVERLVVEMCCVDGCNIWIYLCIHLLY